MVSGFRAFGVAGFRDLGFGVKDVFLGFREAQENQTSTPSVRKDLNSPKVGRYWPDAQSVKCRKCQGFKLKFRIWGP